MIILNITHNKKLGMYDYKNHNKLRKKIFYESNDDELHIIKLGKLHIDQILIKDNISSKEDKEITDFIDNDVVEDGLQEALIKDTLKRKGFSEWVLDSKKDVPLNILAGKYFSLKNIKSLRDEGVMYIKKLEAKYNQQMKDDAK